MPAPPASSNIPAWVEHNARQRQMELYDKLPPAVAKALDEHGADAMVIWIAGGMAPAVAQRLMGHLTHITDADYARGPGPYRETLLPPGSPMGVGETLDQGSAGPPSARRAPRPPGR